MVGKEEIIYGFRSVIEAIGAGKNIERIYFRNGLSGELFGEMYQLIRDHGIPFQYVPAEKIDRITRKNHQGVVAMVSSIEFFKAEDLVREIFEKGEIPLILVLDQVTDVRNFGAIVRSAECAGAHAIVIPDKGAARIGEDAMKTSAGALNFLPVCRTPNLAHLIEYFRQSGLNIVAATEKADCLYTDTDMTGPTAIILGSEDKGISGELLRKANVKVRIPVFGRIGSLNVSVAASLMAYEAVRQRKQHYE